MKGFNRVEFDEDNKIRELPYTKVVTNGSLPITTSLPALITSKQTYILI
jgi:hypothetical protein